MRSAIEMSGVASFSLYRWSGVSHSISTESPSLATLYLQAAQIGANGTSLISQPAIAQEDDVLAREDRVLDLRDHRRLIADDAFEELSLRGQRSYEISAELFLHAPRPIAGLAERANGRRLCHSVGSPRISIGVPSPRYSARAARTSGISRRRCWSRSQSNSVRRWSSAATVSSSSCRRLATSSSSASS